MFRRLQRWREARRLEALYPNPRGKPAFRPVQRARVSLVAAVVMVIAVGGIAWVSRPTTDEARAALVFCGGGRWVTDPARCP